MRVDYKIIFDWIETGARVLDLGCGDGELLSLLTVDKKVKGQGLEINEKSIYACMAKGLSVCHGDIDSGLPEYGDKTFDYVILNQTFQQVKNPDFVLQEALRVGYRAIVGFPNFVYYKGRLQLFFKGKVPVFPSLPYTWYSTPNLHFLSILDFQDYCKSRDIRVEQTGFVSGDEQITFLPNFFAQAGIFLISK